MKDILIIPTFTRPEFLWLCLDYISRCNEAVDLEIRVHVDDHVGKQPPLGEIREVLRKFSSLSLNLFLTNRHGYHGNSYNLMMAYKSAYESQAEYVFMVEDDIVVKSDFFSWHLKKQKELCPDCSIGVNRSAYKGYASLGVCFKKEKLKPIVGHCCHEYFSNMRKYCDTVFADTPFECEQDGLIARLLIGKEVVWAQEPKAQHVGWYGYHRLKSIRPQGSVEQRYQQIKKVLVDGKSLRQCVKDFKDIEPLEFSCNQLQS